jgi:hypothetical protein
MTDLVGQIHDTALGAMRVAKALVEFSRAAGQRLFQAREIVGQEHLDRWVHTGLSIAPAEAMALIGYAKDPVVDQPDVSPTNSMTLTEALLLVAGLNERLGTNSVLYSFAKGLPT